MTDNIKPPKYIEIRTESASKEGKNVCGDHTLTFRDPNRTFHVLCDGMGSGVKAHLAAVMCANRIMELMKSGLDLREAGLKVASFMGRARTGPEFPFAAFCAVSVLSDGNFHAVSYEIPEPLLVERDRIIKIDHRYHTRSGEVVGICSGKLSEGDGIIMMSDGISQAGLGENGGSGWSEREMLSFMGRLLGEGTIKELFCSHLINMAKTLSGNHHKDDSTVSFITARKAEILNLFTGPPSDPAKDRGCVAKFMSKPGKLAVCGSTTSAIVARMTGRSLITTPVTGSFANPPKYRISGVDLVTEGAATMSQAYNILDTDPSEYDEQSSVTELCTLLRNADIVNFIVGTAENKGHEAIAFKQLGVLPRRTIVGLISEKLNSMGIQTCIEYC